jgi:hypothetical protein
MTLCNATTSTDARQDSFRWSSSQRAKIFDAFDDPLNPARSHRSFACENHIPHSTFNDWLSAAPSDLPPRFLHFFRSSDGSAFLRRLVLSSLLVFHHQNSCGLRPITDFLKLLQLDSFVGCSYGALYDLDQSLQDDILQFAQEQRSALAPKMPQKDIAILADEHFHSDRPCLVALEPLSGFLLLETYADNRSCETWCSALQEATKDLPVTIVALGSDQAAALIKTAEQLNAQHFPDLFHLQRDLTAGIFSSFGRSISRLDNDLEKIEERIEACGGYEAADELFTAEQVEQLVDLCLQEQTVQKVKQGEMEKLQTVKDAVKAISEAHHPFDIETGKTRTAEQMKEEITSALDELEKKANEEEMPEKTKEAVKKGRKWMDLLVGSMTWFLLHVNEELEKMEVNEEMMRQIREELLPGMYWKEAASRAKTSEERRQKAENAERLLAKARRPEGEMGKLSEQERREIEERCRSLVGKYVRASSAVEGRNARHSLYKHGQTRLRQRRMKVLNAVQNWVSKDAEGKTAAEKFFEQKHTDAFEWLLRKLRDLPRPVAQRAS